MDQSSSAERRWGRGAQVAFAAAVALGVFVLAFDWNWFRPALEHHLAEKSGRSVRIDDFRVSFSWSLEPTFRLRGVNIANALWADKRPLIVAREITATCTLASLVQRGVVVTRLVLVDADIDLERQADGLRNWRLTHPDYRGPGLIKILALEPVRSRIRFVHRGIGLEVQTAAVPLEAPVDAAMLPLTTRIDFEGTYAGAKFAGDALTSRELTFQRTGRYFSIRGHALSGGTRLDVDGRAADLFNSPGVDAHVALRGPTAAQLRAWLGAALPESPPYAVSASLKKELGRYSLSEAAVKIGSTDVTGGLTFDTVDEQRTLHATLHSELARVEDLEWVKHLAGLYRPGPRVPTDGKAVAASAALDEPPASRQARHLDANLRLEVKRVTMAALPVSASLMLTANAAEGVLKIAPIDLAFAGGHATGDVTLDTRGERPAIRTRIKVRDVRVERMSTSWPANKRIAGAIDAEIDLSAEGDSRAALLATASGSLAMRIVDGSMSRRLDAELGLSGARFLQALVGSDDLVPVKCATAEFEVRNGSGRATTLAIETERTRVAGSGVVDLRSGTFDLLLTPQPDRPGLLELRKSISLRGNPGHVAYELAEAAAETGARRCAERKP